MVHTRPEPDVSRVSSKYIPLCGTRTVEELKKRPSGSGHDGTDYFIKLSDTPVNMNGVSILVNQVEDIIPNTLVASVTIVHIDESGHRFPDGVIVVVLKKIKGELKIFKCIDSYPEA